jgi:hypothetical protein
LTRLGGKEVPPGAGPRQVEELSHDAPLKAGRSRRLRGRVKCRADLAREPTRGDRSARVRRRQASPRCRSRGSVTVPPGKQVQNEKRTAGSRRRNGVSRPPSSLVRMWSVAASLRCDPMLRAWRAPARAPCRTAPCLSSRSPTSSAARPTSDQLSGRLNPPGRPPFVRCAESDDFDLVTHLDVPAFDAAGHHGPPGDALQSTCSIGIRMAGRSSGARRAYRGAARSNGGTG